MMEPVQVLRRIYHVFTLTYSSCIIKYGIFYFYVLRQRMKIPVIMEEYDTLFRGLMEGKHAFIFIKLKLYIFIVFQFEVIKIQLRVNVLTLTWAEL